MLRPIVCIIAAIAPVTAFADVTFGYENFRKHSNGNLEIVLKFTNDAAKPVSFVKAECALLDNAGKAVTTEMVIAQNIPAKGTAYGKNYSLKPGNAENLNCRITTVNY